MLTAENMTLSRGGRLIIDHVSIEIEPAAMTVVLGPNGAGKSSLLKLMSGEWVPDSGRILLDGRPIADWRSVDLAQVRAVLPQESHLAFDFTVEEVVLLGRTPHAASGQDIRAGKTVDRALDMMDLENLRNRLYTSLSGGEKQRVQLARVLAQAGGPTEGRNRCILLDEPTASLDLAFQFKILGNARELARGGATVVSVLHDLNLAAAYADDVVFLRSGRILARGSPRETINTSLIAEVFGVRAEIFEKEDGLRITTHPMD